MHTHSHTQTHAYTHMCTPHACTHTHTHTHTCARTRTHTPRTYQSNRTESVRMIRAEEMCFRSGPSWLTGHSIVYHFHKCQFSPVIVLMLNYAFRYKSSLVIFFIWQQMGQLCDGCLSLWIQSSHLHFCEMVCFIRQDSVSQIRGLDVFGEVKWCVQWGEAVCLMRWDGMID